MHKQLDRKYSKFFIYHFASFACFFIKKLLRMAITYLSFTLMTLVTPIIVNKIGAKLSMFAASLVYSLFMLLFILVNNYLYYVMSSLMGAAAACMFTCTLFVNSLSWRKKTWKSHLKCLPAGSFIFGKIEIFKVYM